MEVTCYEFITLHFVQGNTYVNIARDCSYTSV